MIHWYICKSVFFLQRSRCQWSHTGDGFCLRGHRRAARWRASLETWLSWGQSAQRRAMSEQCTPSRANWPGTLHCDSPEDSTRHPGDKQRRFEIWILEHCLVSVSFYVVEHNTDVPERTVILWTAAVWHCCCPGWETLAHGGSDLCSRNCRFPVQWTTHFELCCEPGRW